jgi:predicted nucleic acid-binding protein
VKPASPPKQGVVLDTGAFIALEKRDAVMVRLVERFAEHQTPLATSAGVVAEVWRGGSGAQTPVAFLLRRTRVIDLTHSVARVLGRMLEATGATDPVGAHIALIAREHGWRVLSSDVDDLHAIDPELEVLRV